MSSDKQVVTMIKDVDQVIAKIDTIPDAQLRATAAQALTGYRNALMKQKAAWENKAVNSPERVAQMKGHINRAHEPVQASTQALASGYKRDQGQGWGQFKEIAPRLKAIMNKHVEYAQNMSPQVQAAVMTIQERLYGVKVKVDANGRPILSPLPSQAEFSREHGIEQALSRQQRVETTHEMPGYGQ